ncbi:MOSC domain-containing protein [Oceanobacillus oncorhynchi]|uniref:6-N-hydroxylaminopurine resistance protein n=1 Tax=Oceanobacillus oncorhynchi TaxID=545501 RepID=A0A0A1MC39_9BACI|nr:MOSC domain-containing protein [Oceanobacillus oncorhynchi]CEI82915.1 6-N-hydroxylaminopurine resistance protein [Oceanobacillus oncorhynchi]
MEEPFVHRILTSKQKEIINIMYLSRLGFAKENPEKKKAIFDKSIFAFPVKHYNEPGIKKLFTERAGEKKENFSVLEMDEHTVFIGDIYQLGEATIQVSQPGIVSQKEMENGLKTGWYFRVLEAGKIQPKKDLQLIERPNPQWSIAACNEVMYLDRENLWSADKLFHCTDLGIIWRKTLRKRLRGF